MKTDQLWVEVEGKKMGKWMKIVQERKKEKGIEGVFKMGVFTLDIICWNQKHVTKVLVA
jgi:hypothetical protein